MQCDCFISLDCSRCATNKYFQIIGSIHDIESSFGLDNTSSLNVQILFIHWGHLAIILFWVSTNLFHVGWNANYELWVKNPILTNGIAHGIWDPHARFKCAYSSQTSDYTIVLSYSGIYNWLYTVGFNSVNQIYNLTACCELLAVFSIPLAKVDSLLNEELLQWLRLNKCSFVHHYYIAAFQYNIGLNFHTGILMGFISIAWSGHLLDVAIPIGRTTDSSIGGITKGSLYLTFLGGLKSNTISLYLSDIAHHHLGLGIVFVWFGHVYSSLSKAFGYRTRDVLYIDQSPGLSSLSTKSLHLALAFALAGCAAITSVVSEHIYSLKPYLYLSYDSCGSVGHWVHHSWIAEFLMMASFPHFAIFFIRDYFTSFSYGAPIGRILAHKGVALSGLSIICLWLGFHTLAVYWHNDTIVAFGEQEKQIVIEPSSAQMIQQSSGKAIYGIGPIFSGIETNVFGQGQGMGTINKSFDSLILALGPGDLLAHHAIALGLHITVLILLKGALHGRGSKLMPDKMDQHYGYSCDGPARGGTCDISAWDSFYLATFWMLNTAAWITFYFHWKHLTLWENTVFQFDQCSTYLNAWFGDYLWCHSTPLIHGYNTIGANDLSIWAWAFLGAHLCWATGFMFLISWRGYWQELIDIILYMHLKTPILYNLWNGDIYTPVALSIVQARFVGLVHFATGFLLTYPPFIIGATC